MKAWTIAAALLLLGLPLNARAEEPCATPAATIEVATLNAWGLPYPLSRNRKRRFTKIERYLESGPDIFGLQEVWSSARSLLVNELRLPTVDADSGLAVVTHLPSTRPSLTPFVAARGVDKWKKKGVLTTKVQLPEGGSTWVAVTHMQAGGSEKAAAVRKDQVDELLGVVRRLDGPTVVMGDFNLYSDLSADRQSTAKMEASGLVDASRATGADQPTYPGMDHRLDRIYLRSTDKTEARPLAAQVGKAKGLSDHRPVQATVELCTAL